MASAPPTNNYPENTVYSENNAQRNGLIIAVMAALLFSTKPILIKYLYQLGIEPLPLMTIRMLMALPIYLIVGAYALKRLPQKPDNLQLFKAAMIGLLGYYLATYLDLQGLQYISAQFERVILYAYPSFVAILGALLFQQKFKATLIFPLLLTYGGLILMYASDISISGLSADTHLKGVLLILASAISFAFYILFSKESIGVLGSLLFTSIAMTSASLAISIHQVIVNGVQLQNYSGEVWFYLAVLSMFATVLPSFMTSEAIKRIGPQKASMTGTLGPVATSIMAIIFLGETLSFSGLVGMLLVIIGIRKLS
ncbi:hypothetical protein A3759_00915 [Thalassolituus sp. HI0120]|nr:hypothetical protein A3759_00915 [Thalassolituus sp. HI0120]